MKSKNLIDAIVNILKLADEKTLSYIYNFVLHITR